MKGTLNFIYGLTGAVVAAPIVTVATVAMFATIGPVASPCFMLAGVFSIIFLALKW